MHVDSWWDSYLEHGGTPKTSIQRCTYDSNIRFGKFLFYEYIVPDNYNIQNILYNRIFQNARRQLVGFLLRTRRNPQNLYIAMYIRFEHQVWKVFYYMNIQCRTTTIFKIYYIYTGFSKMHVDSWWGSYLEHGGTPKTSIQRCTYDSNIRFGKFLLYEYIVPDNYNIQNILYIHRIFQNARRQLVGFLLRTRRNPQNLYIAMYIRFEHQVWKVFYYMNIQCRTTTIFKIYYIHAGFSKINVDSWWNSYLEHGGTPKTSIQRCTYDSNIRFGKAMYIRFEHQVWKVFII